MATISGGRKIVVTWCHALPDGSYGWAMWGEHDTSWIFLSERQWDAHSAKDNRDTIAHEVAHIHTWVQHGRDVPDHGIEWQRIYRRLLAQCPEVG